MNTPKNLFRSISLLLIACLIIESGSSSAAAMQVPLSSRMANSAVFGDQALTEALAAARFLRPLRIAATVAVIAGVVGLGGVRNQERVHAQPAQGPASSRELRIDHAAAYQTDAQLANIKQWAQVPRAGAPALLQARNSTRAVAMTDPAWNQFESFMTSFLNLNARWIRSSGPLLRTLQAERIKAIQDINDSLLLPRGWLMFPDDQVAPGFDLEKLLRAEQVTARYQEAGQGPQTRLIPVYFGDWIDLGYGFGNSAGATGAEFGAADRPSVALDAPKIQSETQGMMAFADLTSERSRQGLATQFGRYIPVIQQGLIKDGWAVPLSGGRIRLWPGAAQTFADYRVDHEAAHAMAKAPSGVSVGAADEAFVQLSVMRGSFRYTQLGSLVLEVVIEIANRRDEPPATLALATLARAAGQDAYAAQLDARNPEALLPLHRYLMELPDAQFKQVLQRARVELHKALSGPLDWELDNPDRPLPMPVAQRASWKGEAPAEESNWLTITLEGGAVVLLALGIVGLFRWLKGGKGPGPGGRGSVSRQVRRAASRTRMFVMLTGSAMQMPLWNHGLQGISSLFSDPQVTQSVIFSGFSLPLMPALASFLIGSAAVFLALKVPRGPGRSKGDLPPKDLPGHYVDHIYALDRGQKHMVAYRLIRADQLAAAEMQTAQRSLAKWVSTPIEKVRYPSRIKKLSVAMAYRLGGGAARPEHDALLREMILSLSEQGEVVGYIAFDSELLIASPAEIAPLYRRRGLMSELLAVVFRQYLASDNPRNLEIVAPNLDFKEILRDMGLPVVAAAKDDEFRLQGETRYGSISLDKKTAGQLFEAQRERVRQAADQGLVQDPRKLMVVHLPVNKRIDKRLLYGRGAVDYVQKVINDIENNGVTYTGFHKDDLLRFLTVSPKPLVQYRFYDPLSRESSSFTTPDELRDAVEDYHVFSLFFFRRSPGSQNNHRVLQIVPETEMTFTAIIDRKDIHYETDSRGVLADALEKAWAVMGDLDPFKGLDYVRGRDNLKPFGFKDFVRIRSKLTGKPPAEVHHTVVLTGSFDAPELTRSSPESGASSTDIHSKLREPNFFEAAVGAIIKMTINLMLPDVPGEEFDVTEFEVKTIPPHLGYWVMAVGIDGVLKAFDTLGKGAVPLAELFELFAREIEPQEWAGYFAKGPNRLTTQSDEVRRFQGRRMRQWFSNSANQLLIRALIIQMLQKVESQFGKAFLRGRKLMPVAMTPELSDAVVPTPNRTISAEGETGGMAMTDERVDLPSWQELQPNLEPFSITIPIFVIDTLLAETPSLRPVDRVHHVESVLDRYQILTEDDQGLLRRLIVDALAHLIWVADRSTTARDALKEFVLNNPSNRYGMTLHLTRKGSGALFGAHSAIYPTAVGLSPKRIVIEGDFADAVRRAGNSLIEHLDELKAAGIRFPRGDPEAFIRACLGQLEAQPLAHELAHSDIAALLTDESEQIQDEVRVAAGMDAVLYRAGREAYGTQPGYRRSSRTANVGKKRSNGGKVWTTLDAFLDWLKKNEPGLYQRIQARNRILAFRNASTAERLEKRIFAFIQKAYPYANLYALPMQDGQPRRTGSLLNVFDFLLANPGLWTVRRMSEAIALHRDSFEPNLRSLAKHLFIVRTDTIQREPVYELFPGVRRAAERIRPILEKLEARLGYRPKTEAVRRQIKAVNAILAEDPPGPDADEIGTPQLADQTFRPMRAVEFTFAGYILKWPKDLPLLLLHRSWRQEGNRRTYGASAKGYDSREFRRMEFLNRDLPHHLILRLELLRPDRLRITFRNLETSETIDQTLPWNLKPGEFRMMESLEPARAFVDAVRGIPSEAGEARASAFRDWFLDLDARGQAVRRDGQQHIGLASVQLHIPKQLTQGDVLVRVLTAGFQRSARAVLFQDALNAEHFLVLEGIQSSGVIYTANGDILPPSRSPHNSYVTGDFSAGRDFTQYASRVLEITHNTPESRGSFALRGQPPIRHFIGLPRGRRFIVIKVANITSLTVSGGKGSGRQIFDRRNDPLAEAIAYPIFMADPAIKRREPLTDSIRQAVLGHHPDYLALPAPARHRFIGYAVNKDYGYWKKLDGNLPIHNQLMAVYRRLKATDDDILMKAQMLTDEHFTIDGLTWSAGPLQGLPVPLSGRINFPLLLAIYGDEEILTFDRGMLGELTQGAEAATVLPSRHSVPLPAAVGSVLAIRASGHYYYNGRTFPTDIKRFKDQANKQFARWFSKKSPGRKSALYHKYSLIALSLPALAGFFYGEPARAFVGGLLLTGMTATLAYVLAHVAMGMSRDRSRDRRAMGLARAG